MDDCRYFEEQISASLDGELSETEEAALARHLQSCEGCRAYRRTLLALRETEQSILPPPPRDLTENIMAAVGKAPAPGKKARILPFPRRARALAAMAALVILAGWAGTRLLSPKGATYSAAAEVPQAAQRAVAAAPAAGMEIAEEESADNGRMMTIESAVTTEDAALDAAPVPFTLRSADGEERTGADCSALWTLAEPTEEPAPAREPDYRILGPEGDPLWQLWEEGESVLLREAEDGPLCRTEAESLWAALGELS